MEGKVLEYDWSDEEEVSGEEEKVEEVEGEENEVGKKHVGACRYDSGDLKSGIKIIVHTRLLRYLLFSGGGWSLLV